MKKLLLILISVFTLFAGTFYPGTITDKNFTVNGKFYSYPFYPSNSPKSAFNWVYERLSDGALFRLMGSEPTQSNVFGWKKIEGIHPSHPKWLFVYLGDVDGDGDTRFDWMVLPVSLNQKAYKLMEVTPDQHYFKYDGPYILDYELDGDILHVGKNFARALALPRREHGYSNLEPLFITDEYQLSQFIQQVQAQKGWNDKDSFLRSLQGLDLNRYNLVLYPFSLPSGSIGWNISQERFIARNVLSVRLTANRPQIGTDDMAYYLLAYLVDKDCKRFIFTLDGKEKIFNLRPTYECTDLQAPVCGYRPVECVTTPCPLMPVHPETFKNYCELKKAGAVFEHDGPCSAGKITDAKALARSLNHFAYNLTGDIYSGSGNILLSPFSVAKALQMLYFGAANQTKEEFGGVFGYSLDLPSSFKRLSDSIPREKNTFFEADSAWFEKVFELYPSYLLLVKDFANSEVFSVDFLHRSHQIRDRINSWVAQKTQNIIQDLLPQNALSPQTRAVLVNAIYFYGGWHYPFEKEKTHRGTFLSENGPVSLDMMEQYAGFKVYENDRFQLIDLPYKNDEFSMLIFLPKGNLCVCDMIDYLKEHNLSEVRSAMKYRYTHLVMPKFTLEWGTRDIAPNLQRIGFDTLFDPQKADLTHLGKPIDPAQRLFVKSVFHKAKLEVFEEGSRGAAATAASVVETSAAPDTSKAYQFIVDHTFLFLITENSNDTIIFLGGIKRLP